ncbi:hypothetical protein F2Q70_00025528 [Brassica cretica]|uniref:Uncharacterized protein n=1 Tax=Brassica cretica TaxID=69181 RepID=A0A8S9I9P7_BRACR|nr:hypothetical protein F2Q68_00024937 [Brassica cretica]KAF2602332.1 hypothetical protein F2Q70_00025528 [Brassica cretica]
MPLSSSIFPSSVYVDESSLVITITSVVVALLVVLFQWRLHQKKQRRKLPPGSMGWPYIGETLRLYTENPNSFFATRQNKYGEIFKTHILGCPCVMISSPEAARMVLVSKAHMFKPTYPPSKERMIGPDALFFHQGPYHSTLKRLVQSSFMPSALRPTVSHIELLALQILSSWTSEKSINTLEHMKRYAFDVAIMSAFGDKEEPSEIEAIKLLYQRLEKGYNSMPLDLPGTLFHKSMKARRELSEQVRRLIEKRRENKREEGGLLGVLLGAKDQKRNGLSDSQIADNIIGVIFAATDTTASVLTWLLKEAVQDVEYDGYLIPKGWKVLPLFRRIHHSPDFFPEPEKFDPSRFEVAPKPYTFMPFGNGVHSCPGSELAKLEMLILLHHLTTSFRWEVEGGEEGIQYGPFPVPKKGLLIRVTPV